MKTLRSATAVVCLCTLPLPLGAAQALNPEVSASRTEQTEATKGSPVQVVDPARLVRFDQAILGQGYVPEVEPNNTFATATVLAGSNLVVRGSLYPAADLDWFAFTATAGDRLYAAVMTSASAGVVDSRLRLFAADGTTLIEVDEDDGQLGTTSSSLANVTLASTGTYFLQLSGPTGSPPHVRPYELHVRVQSGAPVAEVEPNDSSATATPLPVGGWASGNRDPSNVDYFSFSAVAGDTVYVSLDLDPERDNTQWNGRLGIATFGDTATPLILVVDDGSTGSVANPLSEAIFMTVNTTGTYYAYVDSATGATGGPTATYTLSVSIHSPVDEGVNCTTYTSTDVPKTIGPAPGLVSSTITVPGNPRIADIDVAIELNHAVIQDIDAQLRSPAGNNNALFNDIGSTSGTFQMEMATIFDDEAAVTPIFSPMKGLQYKPEVSYRLAWFDGEDAGGTWTLDLRDDLANNAGTLTGWSIRICEPPPPPACGNGFEQVTVFSTDFESNDGGFTHSGTADEWEYGLPTTLATTTTDPVADITTCGSGSACWKTDLDGTYNNSNSQDLLSPSLDLSAYSAPVVVTWAHRYQIENANWDHYFVDLREVGGANPVRLFEHLDATMTASAGSPAVNIGASSGWSVQSRRADSLAGSMAELRFHVDGDSSINFAGAAIDDVTVTACQPVAGAEADLQITKTDGVTTAAPGGSVTYTIVASNAGPDPVTGATVADTFPAGLTCQTTCVPNGTATCTTGPFGGHINDSVDLASGASVTYTSVCSIALGATGTLSNTATVASAVDDPVPGNNSATDNDTQLVPQADIGVTKTDGQTMAAPGAAVTYTVVVTNNGPSNTGSVLVTDDLPDLLLGCSWTAVLGGGATGNASGSGDLSESLSMPAASTATYTVSCTLDAGAFAGTLTNTADVSSGNDPNASNDSATDNTVVDTDLLFSDGFESGDTSAWSATEPPTPVMARFGPEADSGAVDFRVATGNRGAVMVSGISAGHERAWLVRIESRSGGQLVLTMAAANRGGWARTAPVALVGEQFDLRLEWRRASFEGLANGELRLLVNGAEVASLIGLDNTRLTPRRAEASGDLDLVGIE